jgi:hypothetical protein
MIWFARFWIKHTTKTKMKVWPMLETWTTFFAGLLVEMDGCNIPQWRRRGTIKIGGGE